MNIKTIYKEVGITETEAKQIINLLNTNEWSRPNKPYTIEEVMREQNFLIAYNENYAVIGFLRLKKVQWYQWELYNLVIDKLYRGKGTAQLLIKTAKEYALAHRGGILQATIDPANKSSISLFKKMAWKYSVSFIHPAYKKPYEVWNISI